MASNLLKVRASHYTTKDGAWTLRRADGNSKWRVYRTPVDLNDPLHYLPRMSSFPVLRSAEFYLRRSRTRYTYHVKVGEACEICSEIRADDNVLGWWWHTTCRAGTDTEGRTRYLADKGE